MVIASTTLHDVRDRLRREELLQLPDEVARLLGAAGEAEQRQREEDQRDGGEQPEVGDHRREVGAPVGEELRERLGERSAHAGSIVWRRGCRVRSRRPDRDLLPGRGRRRRRRATAPSRLDARRSEPQRSGSSRAGVGLLDGGDVALRLERPLGDAARGGAARGQRLRRPRGRPRASSRATSAGPTSGLVFYDLRTCLRAVAATKKKPKPPEPGGEEDRDRRCVGCSALALVVGGLAPSRGAAARPAASASTSTSTTARWSRSSRRRPRRASRCSRWRARRSSDDRTSSASSCASTRCSRATSCSAPGAARATTSTSTASRRRPELLGPLGERLAAAAREHEPDAVRLAGPALGAVALAASASLASGLPFVIVRDAAKEYGTGEPPRGAVRAGRARLPDRGRRHLRRRARRGRGGAARGRARRPKRRLRRRSRGGRSGRARPSRRPPALALPCRRPRPGRDDRCKIRMVEPRNR